MKGIGVKLDLKQAQKWHELAAENGNSAAQLNLEDMYHSGLGIAIDLQKGFILLSFKLFK